jgi:RsiW-degrading membrane proteinase PrsW (M82 family)
MAGMMTLNASTYFYSLLGGMLPAIFWLWFWLRQDKINPEPKRLLSIVFITGMVSVAFVLPLQQYVQTFLEEGVQTLAVWAFIEEVIKFLAFFMIAWSSRFLDEPIDYAMYLITAALGFAAAESALFLVDPIETGKILEGLTTGDLRFLGAAVLHAEGSAIIGIALGLTFYSNNFIRSIALIFSIVAATALHTLFNFFIMNYDKSILIVFSFFWMVAVLILLVFEKIKLLRE